MGIYDRDYIRERSGAGPAGSSPITAMRMWSANTWLIVICVAVFLIDHYTPIQFVPAETFFREGVVVSSIDQSALQYGPVYEFQPGRRGRDVTIVSNGQTVLIGVQQVMPMRTIQSFLHFSTQRGFLRFEFWRFIGFQFLHASMGHIFFNMLALFFFGPLVERYLGSKRYVAFYLLCGIFGAMMFLLLNLGGLVASMMLGSHVAIPGLIFDSPYTPLIGASAGVFGVLMAGAFLAPNAIVLLFFLLPLRLRTLAYALVVIALVTVITGGSNAGGEAGHLGGALAGFYFIRHPRHLHNFFDVLGRVDPSSHHYRDKPGRARRPRTEQIDRILDKVNERGVGSLTAREKRILAQASRRDER